MERVIILNKEEVRYQLSIRERSKHMRVTITPGGLVKVSVPLRFDEKHITKFLTEKSEWLLSSIKKMKHQAPKESVRERAKMYVAHKDTALTIAKEKVAHYAAHYDVTWQKITIRNQTTRWGSCSSRKTLSFNYKIALLPEHLVNYIVVHEVCHLIEMNHGRAFWELVSNSMPDYKSLRMELKKYTT